MDALRQNWGEWAALTLVAIAAISLIRGWFFKNKTAGGCCKKGCSPPPSNSKK